MAHCFSSPRDCVTGTSSEAWLDILPHQLQTFLTEKLFFFFAKATLARFCGIFFVRDVLDAIVVFAEWKIFHIHVVVIMAAS